MDLTTIIGLIVAAIGLLGGMFFKHVPFSSLANPAALFIILVGTAGAVLNATPKEDISKLGALFKIVLLGKKQDDNKVIINNFVDYAKIARKDGLLAMESTIDKVEDNFTKRALSLLMTGQDAEYVKLVLETEIENVDERHRGLAGIFSQAGTYAPTLGVLGAVIGLIAAMGFMDDTVLLANAIAGAFMATIYGIFTGYVLWNPFANRLKRLNSYEILSKRIVAEGVLMLLQGFAPDLVEENLLTYLTPKDMEAYRKTYRGES